jgi:hypothetical protein
MDNRKKILLGEKDIISRDNEDMFININLNKTFAEIRDEKFENIFDVAKQYEKERNTSRNFRIYGTISSTVVHSDGIALNILSSQTAAPLFQVTSTPLVYNEVNAFGKKIGKYLIEFDYCPYEFLFIQIPGNGINYSTQIFPQQLVFKDLEGNFIDYGTQTNEIDGDGNTIEVNNDFYFLYNKHWIKKDLLIKRDL